MIKAIFIDYTGTTVHQTGLEMNEIVRLVQENSLMNDREEILKYFYDTRVEKEKTSYLNTYLSEDEIIDLQLIDLTENYNLTIDHSVLKDLIHQFWKNTPVYEDVKPFFDMCPLPIYILTNNGYEFVVETMKHHHLSPASIISSDDVKAYKPKQEIFEKALKISGLYPEEVIHVGDSWSSDVEGALNAGIFPVWLQRDQMKEVEGICSIRSLLEILKLI